MKCPIHDREGGGCRAETDEQWREFLNQENPNALESMPQYLDDQKLEKVLTNLPR